MYKLSIANMFLLHMIVLIAGCSTKANKIGEGASACPEPRPQICTQEYNPVCGIMKQEAERTYSNACVACSDHTVTSYKSGKCE